MGDLCDDPFTGFSSGIGQDKKTAGIDFGKEGIRFVHSVHPDGNQALVGMELEGFGESGIAEKQAGEKKNQQAEDECDVAQSFHWGERGSLGR